MDRRTRPHPAYIAPPQTEVLPPVDRFRVQQTETTETTPGEYSRLLFSRKFSLIAVAGLGAIAGVLLALMQTPMYRATASLEVQNLNDRFLNLTEVTPVSSSGPASTSPDVQSIIRLLNSHALGDRVIAKMKKNMPTDERGPALSLTPPEWLINWFQKPEERRLTADEIQRRYAYDAVNSVKVRAAGQSRVIDVTIESSDPDVAYHVANSLAEEFIEENLEARLLLTQSTGKLLTRQLDQTRQALEQSENALQQYTAETGLLFVGADEKRNVSDQKLAQLQETITHATTDRISKQSRLETVLKQSDGELPNDATTTVLREYAAKLMDLRRELADLALVYAADYRKVKRVESQIVTLQEAMRTERAAIVQRLRNDLDEAMRRESLLQTQYADNARLVTADGQKAIRYNLLKREVDTNRQLYEGMLHRVNEANLASATRASNIRVFDPAKRPDDPYTPNVPLHGVFGFMFAGVLGIGVVVLRHHMGPNSWASSQAALESMVMDLGSVPSLPRGSSKTKGLGGLALSRAGASGIPELITWEKRFSPEAESFRSLALSILFSRGSARPPQVLVVTGPGPGEGKTTIAANLSIALADTGLRVVLVDADLRKPRVHEIFHVNSDTGLSTLLADSVMPEQAFNEALKDTRVPGLHVLPSGPAHEPVSKLLCSDSLEAILQHCRTRFDTVVIDSPPLLPFPDARILARKSDGVVVVARWSETSRNLVERIQDRLLRDESPVLGVVWNDCSAAPSMEYGRYLKARSVTAGSR